MTTTITIVISAVYANTIVPLTDSQYTTDTTAVPIGIIVTVITIIINLLALGCMTYMFLFPQLSLWMTYHTFYNWFGFPLGGKASATLKHHELASQLPAYPLVEHNTLTRTTKIQQVKLYSTVNCNYY